MVFYVKHLFISWRKVAIDKEKYSKVEECGVSMMRMETKRIFMLDVFILSTSENNSPMIDAVDLSKM